MSHGNNANIVHKLRRFAGAVPLPVVSFIPVALPAPSCAPRSDIRMELRRGATNMTITWPAAAAGECTVWMRELLRDSGRSRVADRCDAPVAHCALTSRKPWRQSKHESSAVSAYAGWCFMFPNTESLLQSVELNTMQG